MTEKAATACSPLLPEAPNLETLPTERTASVSICMLSMNAEPMRKPMFSAVRICGCRNANLKTKMIKRACDRQFTHLPQHQRANNAKAQHEQHQPNRGEVVGFTGALGCRSASRNDKSKYHGLMHRAMHAQASTRQQKTQESVQTGHGRMLNAPTSSLTKMPSCVQIASNMQQTKRNT